MIFVLHSPTSEVSHTQCFFAPLYPHFIHEGADEKLPKARELLCEWTECQVLPTEPDNLMLPLQNTAWKKCDGKSNPTK